MFILLDKKPNEIKCRETKLKKKEIKKMIKYIAIKRIRRKNDLKNKCSKIKRDGIGKKNSNQEKYKA